MELKSWQRLVLDALRELSDASFQERVWLRRQDSQLSSPGETVNQLFDDSGLGDLLEDEVAFSDKADALLRQLSALVDTIDFGQPVEDLLSDDGWLKLRQLASQAMSAVKAALNGE